MFFGKEYFDWSEIDQSRPAGAETSHVPFFTPHHAWFTCAALILDKVRVGPPPVKNFAFVDFYILSMASARSSAGINGESTERICIDNIIIVLVPLLKSERSVA